YKQMYHVLSMIGGYAVQNENINQIGLVYSPLKAEEQLEALDFILNNAFNPPKWLSNPEYLSRIENSNNEDKLLYFQLRLLKELLESERMKRLEYMDDVLGFNDLQEKVLSRLQFDLFKEIGQKKFIIDSRK